MPNDVLDKKAFLQQRQMLGLNPKHADIASPTGAVLLTPGLLHWRVTTATAWVTCVGAPWALTMG
eukprot:7897034-Pyramimonas_sp.AAC.1